MRRSESRVVVEGLEAKAQMVALANPEEIEEEAAQRGRYCRPFSDDLHRSCSGSREPARAEDAYAADRARHRLRRRQRDRHARDRRGRARRVAEVHRAARRAQRADRFAAGDERSGTAAAAPVVARADRARRANTRSQHRFARDAVAAARRCDRREMLPKPAKDTPELYGVRPSFAVIHSLRRPKAGFSMLARQRTQRARLRARRSGQGRTARLCVRPWASSSR